MTVNSISDSMPVAIDAAALSVEAFFARAVASGRTDDAMKLCDKNAMVEYIEAYEAAKKGKKEEKSSQKSYDINEFIDAAIKRSFDDID